ncbi:hypothetical protein B0H11DRAFT_2183316 [Mycena galericulata]|nr:hypothetical protein B0H11DRAFT_2183316 [Mycena galericulata]
MRRMLSSGVDGTVGVDGSRGAKVRGRAAGVRGVSHRTTWRGATPKDGRRAVSGENKGRERGWYISAIMKARASLTEREMCGMGDDILREGQRTKMSHPSRLFGVQISARDEVVPRVSLVRKAHKRTRWDGSRPFMSDIPTCWYLGPDAERKKGCLTFEKSLRIGIETARVSKHGIPTSINVGRRYKCDLTLGTKEATTRRPTPKKDIQIKHSTSNIQMQIIHGSAVDRGRGGPGCHQGYTKDTSLRTDKDASWMQRARVQNDMYSKALFEYAIKINHRRRGLRRSAIECHRRRNLRHSEGKDSHIWQGSTQDMEKKLKRSGSTTRHRPRAADRRPQAPEDKEHQKNSLAVSTERGIRSSL